MTPLRLLALLALAFGLALHTAAAQDSSAASAASLFSIHGTVMNGLTHQPVARALVSLQQFGLATLSDNEGHFGFRNVPGGTYSVSARRPGFDAEETGSSTSRRTVSVTAAGAEVVLELSPLGSIAGEVILAGEDAVDTIQLQLLRQQVEDGHAHWTYFRNAEVMSDGRFRFGNLPAGAYLLHSGSSLDPAPAEAPPGMAQPRYGYVPCFYPGVRELGGATPIALGRGQQAEVKLPLTREPYYRVALPVANPAAARFISFNVSSDSFLGLPARYTPEDGTVHMELPAGHYRLEGRSYEQHPLSGLREFDVANGVVRGGAITMVPVTRIPVSVHEELLHPPPAPASAGDDERGANASEKLSLRLLPLEDARGANGNNSNLQPDPSSPGSDRAVLENVTPGRYWVDAHAFLGYVASMTSGGVDLLAEPLTVNADGSAPPIDVLVRDDTATLSATLAPGLQASNGTDVFLQLIPLSGAAAERTESFSSNGTAQLSSLAPGAYLALAVLAEQKIPYRDGTALAAFADKGQRVMIEPGGTASVTLSSLLPAGGAIGGGTR